MVAVHVADTGIGIPENARSRVFEEFFQVDQTLARRRGGTGLGLAIAGRLVRLMGGEISVESVVGTGSRFTFTLPQSEGTVAGVPEFGASDGQEPLAGEVLVAEADGAERRRLAMLLEGTGLRVGMAVAGDEALARLRTGRYDALVLDLGLARPDAAEVIEQLRRNPRLGDLAVLALAAGDLDPAARERLGPPVVAVLKRGEPLPRALVASLRKVLSARSGLGSARGPAPEPGAPPRDARVLVVEDNEDNLFTLRQMLTPLGLDVVAVTTGREAIDYCRTRLPDLVLMDVQLPGMSGLQATGAIRGLPGGMTIPIVALTAQAMKGDRERILAAGCDEYLSKPIQPKMLTALVRRLLARDGELASDDAGSPDARNGQHGTHTPGR
jgi:CheY-like chemotaxis protein